MDERTIQAIISLLEKYDYHPECIQEIMDLILYRGIISQFYKMFRKNTEVLMGDEADVLQHPNFEKLKKANNLYSMRIKCSKANLRILYTYRKGKLALLLCCFYERSDSKETYEKYIPIALRRLKEMEE